MGASSARISDTCVGDGPFLCTQDACYFTRTPESAYHLRSVSFFEKPTLSRWKCVYFHWSGSDLRVANGPHRYRYSHSPDRSFYTARRTTIRTSIRSSMAQLQKASPTMAMSELDQGWLDGPGRRATVRRRLAALPSANAISKSSLLRYVHQSRGLTLL